MKYLFIICLVSVPNILFSQFRVNDLSSESKELIENAQQDKRSTKLQQAQDREGFNLAITSRFEGGLFPAANGTDLDLFNVTSLEFYLPALSVTSKTRFLATFRFSIPILNEGDSTFLYVPRLGFGIGFSSIFLDARDKQERGWTGNINFLIGMDFDFSDIKPKDPLLSERMYVSRLDFGFRFNYFISKNFAIVYGLDMGIGFVKQYRGRTLGSDGFPTDPLQDFGRVYSTAFTFGATIGIMF